MRFRTRHDEHADEFFSFCERCGYSWESGTNDTAETCLWCDAEFCRRACYEEHAPCAAHPGPCPACGEDGLEPTERGGDICGECHYSRRRHLH